MNQTRNQSEPAAGQQRSPVTSGPGGQVMQKTQPDVVSSGESPGTPLQVSVRVLEVAGSCERADEHRFDSAAWRAIVLGVVLVVAGVYSGLRIGRGWVPADDGILAQSAIRVLHGQLPQRDFAEIYTGGLSFIHAVAFRAFGVNLMSLRICVFLFFLAWIPAVYWIALRFTAALPAGLITLVAVVWSYPNYPAAMPSWYNLFFATFGAAALLRYLETRRRRWLFIAGCCGGVSLLIKVIGAYYIAGVLLFVAFLEQGEAEKGMERNQGWPYRIFSGGALLAFLATLMFMLHARMGLNELYTFVLPSAVLVALILMREPAVRAGTWSRFRSLFRLVGPFAGGVLAPCCIFLLPYVRSGAVGTFFRGVVASAVARASGLAVFHPVGPEVAGYALAVIAILAAGMYWDKFQGPAVGAALALGAVAMVYCATRPGHVGSSVWCSAAALTPLAVLFGAGVVFAQQKHECPKLQQRQVVLLLSLAATCTLVQYPFAAPIYLSYALPLTLLALVAVVALGRKQRGTHVFSAVLGFYLLFGGVILVPHYIYELTHVVGHMEPMKSARAGGLQIEGAAFFDGLAQFLRAHSPNGKIYAGNDCPELYFLSGLQNVAGDDGGAGAEEVLKALAADDLNVVVINEHPFFPTAKMSPEVTADVAKRFPHSALFGIFRVFWKR
jgi:hypothetical protein